MRPKTPGDKWEQTLEKDDSLKLHGRTEGLINMATGHQQDPAGGGGFDVGDGMRVSRFSAGGRGEIKEPAVLRHRSGMLETCLIFKTDSAPSAVMIFSFPFIFLKLASDNSPGRRITLIQTAQIYVTAVALGCIAEGKSFFPPLSHSVLP